MNDNTLFGGLAQLLLEDVPIEERIMLAVECSLSAPGWAPRRGLIGLACHLHRPEPMHGPEHCNSSSMRYQASIGQS